MCDKTIENIKGGLIVSCQAELGDPFNDSESIVKFAKAALMGGAIAIRSEGVDKTRAILNNVNLPVIGLVKSEFEDGTVKITGSEKHVLQLIEIGTNIIAIDGTFRMRNGFSGPDFIKYIKEKHQCKILADIATIDEAIACANAGADYISSTLNGYTPETFNDNNGEPNFNLVEKLIKNINIPIIAEGRISTPKQAELFIKMGVYAIVVGTAITRPRVITKNFVNVINKN